MKTTMLFPLLPCLLLACSDQPEEHTPAPPPAKTCQQVPLFEDRAVDVLFMVDNSGATAEMQANMLVNSTKFFDTLNQYSPDSKLPNLRVGVVNCDLGAGKLYTDSSCKPGGDGGKLHNKPRKTGCTPPGDKWIEHKVVDGKAQTNVPGAGDPLTKVKQAFSCIAEVGDTGCGFEHILLSPRMALDPKLNVNPGFLRDHALLAIFFLADEDDCSASDEALFDPSKQGLNDPLGPLTSFRCFEFGVTCECPGQKTCDRHTIGVRTNCKPEPTGKYLHTVKSFATFFRSLKKTPGRVIMASVGCPTGMYPTIKADGKPTTDPMTLGKVEVGMRGTYPALKPGCTINIAGSDNECAPAIRLQALVHSFARELTAREKAEIKGGKEYVPYWIDDLGAWRKQNFFTHCSANYSPALESFAGQILERLETPCLSKIQCPGDCTKAPGFTVNGIKKCPASLADPKLVSTACGAHCPCWRALPAPECTSKPGMAPYALQVMGPSPAPHGTYATVCSPVTP